MPTAMIARPVRPWARNGNRAKPKATIAELTITPTHGLDAVPGSDLVIVTKIEIPKRLNAKQEKLLREFAQDENEKGILPETQGFWKQVKEFFNR